MSFLDLVTSWSSLFSTFSILSLAYLVSLALYRLYLSPVSQFPGPKLAALTGWYEFYFECVLAGQYVWEVQHMHAKYGSIVRISPWELHIDDPDFFEQIYSVTSKLDKDHWFYRAFDSSLSGFATANAELHRIRRAAVSKFFSPSNIARMEPLIKECVGKLCLRLKEHGKTGVHVDLSNAYRCLSSDVISEYAIPEAPVRLDEPDFAASYNRVLRDFSHIALFHRHLGFVFQIINAIPRWVIQKTNPGPGLAVYDNMVRVRKQAYAVSDSKGQLSVSKSYPIILCGIYNSDLPPSEKTGPRLEQEAMTLVGAGTETTGNTLSVATFHLISKPSKLQKLKAELSSLQAEEGGDMVSYRQLESLPYLTGCVNEALRLGSSVSGRMPRVNRHSPIRYKSYLIPPGTPVSMCQRDLHYSPRCFPDPTEFSPERWLVDQSEKRRMDKYFVPFSKGSRSCVGMNLALAEIYMTIGNIFRRFDLELYQTSLDDLSLKHDFFSPFGPTDSKGLRVKVTSTSG